MDPLPSNRQHLSFDDCCRFGGKIIRTVLCCVVYMLIHVGLAFGSDFVFVSLFLCSCFRNPGTVHTPPHLLLFLFPILTRFICFLAFPSLPILPE